MGTILPKIIHLFFLFVKDIVKYNSYIMIFGGIIMLVFDFHKIGAKFYTFRKAKGMTQAEVAEAAGLSDRTYADIERGGVNMRIETILRICNVLDITPNDVLTEESDVPMFDENDIIKKLGECSPKERETALRILSVYLDSLK